MPTYDYKCNMCGKTYDVFHKGRELVEDVVCPSCESTSHTRLISAPNISMGGSASSEVSPGCSTDGGCCGGTCGLN